MSASFGSSSNQEVDVNITPIIDCFTVLITFMLASASFLSIGILDAGVPGIASDSKEAPPPYELNVRLKKDNSISVKLSGKASKSANFNAVKDPEAKSPWDLAAATREIASIKKAYPAVTALTLSADDDVTYKSIVESMDKIRKEVPDVLLGE